jgi:hypothetical protein
MGMGVMMWMMMRGEKKAPDQPATTDTSSHELSRLRAEVDQLRAAQRP